MARASAQRELLASREDVWKFVAEPHHFPDWWPGIGGVQPDRRGVAEGARWHVRGVERPTFARRPASSGMLLVRGVREPERLAWTLTGDHLDAELRLDEGDSPNRTMATLVVEAPWVYGFSRSLPRRALTRLYALCQTGAEF
jgi:uncharacterized protein YndB with AHSA1/START domain